MAPKRLARQTLQPALIAASLCALAIGQAHAGGLTLYEIGTADVGLASAGYGARAQDASTVLTNPAGMTLLDGTQILAGLQVLSGDLEFDSVHSANMASGGNGGNPIGSQAGGSSFLSYSLPRDWKVGFGVAGNFGLKENYNDDWAGRYRVKKATLLGISLLPSVAYRLNDHWSLGATLNAMYGILKNRVAINNIDPRFADGQLETDDKQWGWGGNLGLMYELNQFTRFGLTYTSQVNLDFKSQAQFSGVAPGLSRLLAARGLLNSTLDLGIKVPQGVMASAFHQIDEQWAVLGSVGWQQWSKFGEVEIGINSNDPKSLTTSIPFKNTWHGALGAQLAATQTWLLNFGVAYDSDFQNDSGKISPLVPADSAWRFGLGAQNQYSKAFSWGVAGEYLYAGTLGVNSRSAAPVALGGRGDLVGSYEHTNIFILSANATWKY